MSADHVPNPDRAGSRVPIEKQVGVTPSERYLDRICTKTFLSLWSYPAVYRDQELKDGGDGKEIADLLVVFGNDVIIFSDKNISFRKSAPLDVAWPRWYRRAVLAGATQVWGAERWLRNFPNRVFLDRKCTIPFPYPLPIPPAARYHCVVVAHGASPVCTAHLGGSGSLMWVSPDAPNIGQPFVLTDLDITKPFVHVFDDTSLAIVMSECDTISDFTAYLMKKERFLRSQERVVSTGEEDLLAVYLKRVNPAGEHDFYFDEEFDGYFVEESNFDDYKTNPQRLRKLAADRVSYVWDSLIESFAGNVLAGTLYRPSTSDVAYHEGGLRLLARESRVRRRSLGEALFELLEKARREDRFNWTRVIEPSYPDDPHYVFLLVRRDPDIADEKYRAMRRGILLQYCRVVRLIRPNAHTVVGIAADTPTSHRGSEDLIVYDGRNFPPDERAEAQRCHAEGLLKNVGRWSTVVSEYPPEVPRKETPMPPHGGRYPGTGRNARCPCNSGRKYKVCCGP